jgi:hypothetical protein
MTQPVKRSEITANLSEPRFLRFKDYHDCLKIKVKSFNPINLLNPGSDKFTIASSFPPLNNIFFLFFPSPPNRGITSQAMYGRVDKKAF